MSKLIYVDRLKKDILDLPHCYNGFSDTYDKACIIGVIDEQPTVEERKWIPCSDRLPEEGKEVLASTIDGYLYIADYEIHNGNVYWEETTEYTMLDVLAWMPLPEPYTEGNT